MRCALNEKKRVRCLKRTMSQFFCDSKKWIKENARIFIIVTTYCDREHHYYPLLYRVPSNQSCCYGVVNIQLDVTHTFDITSAVFLLHSHWLEKQSTTFYWPHSVCSLDLDRIVLHSSGIFFPHDCLACTFYLALCFLHCAIKEEGKKTHSEYDWITNVKICIAIKTTSRLRLGLIAFALLPVCLKEI